MDKQGKIDYSSRQMQLIVLSLVGALAQATKQEMPSVIDTPLDRLNKGNKDGLINHWKMQKHQVILLSQDTEITRVFGHGCKRASGLTTW